jgi:large subunit ribosomal protein L32e
MTKEEAIKELTKIKGIGKAKAEALYNKGFDSLDKIKKSSVEELTKVEGITETIAIKIKDQLEEKTEIKTKVKKPQAKKEKPETKVKPKTEKKLKPKEKTEEKEEKPKKETKEVEPVEEEKEKYIVKIKPKLSKELKERLIIRKQIKSRKPEFLREEWFRYGKIPKQWRKPDGMTSKMRLHKIYRPPVVRVGYRGPKETRGLHSSGFREVIVYNVNDLDNIDPKTQAARIGSSVGTKKRMDLEKKAEKLDIRILNPGGKA